MNKRIKIGFTGTQNGMTFIQKRNILKFLNGTSNDIIEFHHGDCIGADSECHGIINNFNKFYKTNVKIIIHPPINESKRAFCKGDIILPKDEYLNRNKHIVDSIDLLFVAPKELHEQLRSGTWSTYRYAKNKKHKPVIIFYPDGTIWYHLR